MTMLAMLRRIVVLPLLLGAGCADWGKSALAPVKGEVSYQRKKLNTGTIVFAPDPLRGTNGPLARGAVQPDGSYRLRSGEEEGVAPGFYRVTIVAVKVEPTPGQVAPRSLLPEKYRDPELSGLTCEVHAGRENTINFNLE